VDQQPGQQLNIQASPEDLKGRYANIVFVSQAQEEFILDFMAGSPQGVQFLQRMYLSPGHIKRLARLLDDQIKTYESTHGKIEEADEPQGKIGFK
jgi:hypothetical protein